MTNGIQQIFTETYLIQCLLGVSLFIFGVGIILRFIYGKGNSLTSSISACMGILLLYIIVIIYGGLEGPSEMFTQSLPFVGVLADYRGLYGIKTMGLSVFLVEMSKVFLLSAFVNVCHHYLIRSKSKRIIVWLFQVGGVTTLALLVNWWIDSLFQKYLPESFGKWIPFVAFVLIGICLLLSFIKGIFKLVNPFLAILSSFFGTNVIGNILRGSFLTTIFLVVAVIIFDKFGYFGMNIYQGTAAMYAFLPVVIMLFVIWYIVCKLL